MAEYRRAEVVSGLFVLLSVLLFALFAFKVIGIQIPFFEKKGVECEALFDNVETLDRAAKVTIGGHRIGTVTDIRPASQLFTSEEIAAESQRTGEVPAGWAVGRERHVLLVRFRITDSDVRIGDGASVMIVQEGFIGPWNLAVDPGTWDVAHKPPFIRENRGTVVRFPSRRVDTLKDFIPMVRPIVHQVEGILATVQHGLLDPLLQGQEENLREIVPELSRAITEARAAVGDIRHVLDASSPESPIRNLNTLLNNVDGTVTTLRERLVNEVVPQLNKALATGQEAVDAAKQTLEEAKKILKDADPKVQTLLANLADESGRLKARIDEVQVKLTRLLDDLDQLAAFRQADLAELMRTMRNTAWELEMTARKVRANPAVLIFGDEEKRLEAEPRDDTGLRSRGRVKPYDQRDEAPTKKE